MTAKKSPVKRDSCGQRKGWNAHNRHDESQCDPCLRANADYMLEYRRRKGITLATLYTPDEIEGVKRAAIAEARRDAVIGKLTRRASRSKRWKRVVQ